MNEPNKKEYIEREEIREIATIMTKRLLRIPECSARNARIKGIRDMYNVLTKIPSADVVEVVRCKDCVYYNPYYYNNYKLRGDGYCSCEDVNWEHSVKETFFCGYGDRRIKAHE